MWQGGPHLILFLGNDTYTLGVQQWYNNKIHWVGVGPTGHDWLTTPLHNSITMVGPTPL
jgi:hypothetical protein